MQNMVEQCYNDDEVKAHVNRVVKLCRKFYDKGILVNWELLKRAAELHDVAKGIVDNDCHQERKCVALALREKNKREYEKDGFDDICIIIENHRGVFFPYKYFWESAILRICDKLDKFNKVKFKVQEADEEDEYEIDYTEEIKESRKSCKKSMKKIKECFNEFYGERRRPKERLKDFEKIYKELHQWLDNPDTPIWPDIDE